MRVHELARKLGMESRILIPELVRLGLEVSSHNNALDDDAVNLAVKALQGGDPSKIVGGENLAKPVSTSKKPGTKTPKSRATGKGKAKSVSTAEVEEAPKPEKKHILIKHRKPEPEPQAEEVQPAISTDIISPSPLEEELPTVEEPAIPSPLEPEGSEVAATAVEESKAEPAITESRETAPETKPPAPRHEKKDFDREEERLKEEKLKKARKGPKPRNEDLFAARYEDAARWQDLRPLPTLRREERVRHVQPSTPGEITKPRKKTIKLSPGISVKEFAELIGQRPADVIRKLMEVGLALTLNQPMNLDAGVLIAEGFGVNTEISGEKEGEDLLEEMLEATGKEELELVARAPVVTIMGHVDHGKTSLLDAIRQTKVTDRESGGITQHIGAYSVSANDKKITFLDTPGHEAFTAMRARGAQSTDIVVLVVAADDGVMPQTLEAADHAKAANVPIIVAINKMDAEGANPDRVKQQLSDHELIPESWGGQTIYVEVSAKQKSGLDTLLDMILLQAEVLELQASISNSARGVILEAKLDRGRGPVATVLVQSGILRIGETFVAGSVSGRIRAMGAHDGSKVREVGPSTPVEVIGLLGVPSAGDQFVVVSDERAAREIADARRHKQRTAELGASGTRMTLDDLYAQGGEEDIKQLSVVVKADVQGSAGALCESLEKISSDMVKVQVIHRGIGGITESDVLLASASKALVIGFHVRPEPKAATLAEREGVDIRLYTVIYNVIDDIKSAAQGLLAPTLTERVLGRAEVRQVFTIPKVGAIAGCYVSDGMIARASEGIRVLRDNVLVYEGKLGSLRRFKDDVREVQQGYECGIGVENFNDIKIGDILEAFVLDKEPAKL